MCKRYVNKMIIYAKFYSQRVHLLPLNWSIMINKQVSSDHRFSVYGKRSEILTPSIYLVYKHTHLRTPSPYAYRLIVINTPPLF